MAPHGIASEAQSFSDEVGVGSKITDTTRAAVFLDRDGVLNEAIVRDGRPYPPQSIDELVIVRGAETALARLKRLGFVLIVVTNQPDVGRGTQDRDTVDALNVALASRLPIDKFLVCPHDDVDRCECRKPLPGLILRGASELRLDLSSSFMVGDRWKDIAAGQAAGVRTVFIDYHYNERRPAPPAEITVSTISEAADWIGTHYHTVSGEIT